jgi:hypothetical protein
MQRDMVEERQCDSIADIWEYPLQLTIFSRMNRDDSDAGFVFVSDDGNVNELSVVVLSNGCQ